MKWFILNMYRSTCSCGTPAYYRCADNRHCANGEIGHGSTTSLSSLFFSSPTGTPDGPRSHCAIVLIHDCSEVDSSPLDKSGGSNTVSILCTTPSITTIS